MADRTALIAGATGAIGSALARELAPREDWRVLGLSRSAPATPLDGVDYLQADMADAQSCQAALAGHASVTHLFYCGRATHAEQVLEDPEHNLALLANLLDAVEASSPALRHVHLVQGGKYYGVHVGPFATPAREDAPRAPIPNFNYDQQDFLQRRAAGARWHWSASRPNTLIHYSPDIARNIVGTLGAYAAIARELGAALDFPGHPGAYDSVTQMTSIELLARGIAWMSAADAGAAQAFNLTNTDVFRWRSLWRALADAFDMPVGEVRPLRLAEIMAGREPTWRAICARHDLVPTPLAQVANWGFADATLERYWDEILSHNKARASGFHDWDDSEARFLAVLRQYQQARILPS